MSVLPYHIEKTLADAKDVYTDHLIEIITPSLYEGFLALYNTAQRIEETNRHRDDNRSVLEYFQLLLFEIKSMSEAMIRNETERIRVASRSSDIFDDLIRATIKSHILVLTYSLLDRSEIISAREHEKVPIPYFIHTCYVECAGLFYTNPYLFWTGYDTLQRLENQQAIYDLIKIAIKTAIRRVLPMRLVLTEYLNDDDAIFDMREQDDAMARQVEDHDVMIRQLLEREHDNDNDHDKRPSILMSQSHTPDYDEMRDADADIDRLNTNASSLAELTKMWRDANPHHGHGDASDQKQEHEQIPEHEQPDAQPKQIVLDLKDMAEDKLI